MATSNMGPEGGSEKAISVDYGGWIQESFNHYKSAIGEYILAGVIVLLILAAASACVLPVLIIAGPMFAGLYYFVNKKLKGEAAEIGDLFYAFTTCFVDTMIVGLIVAVATLVLTAVFNLIPILGILLSWILGGVSSVVSVFALMAVLEGRMKGVDAVKHGLNVWMKEPVHLTLYAAIAGFLGAVGLIACLIGIFVTFCFGSVMMMVAYNHIEGGDGAPAAADTEETTPFEAPPSEWKKFI